MTRYFLLLLAATVSVFVSAPSSASESSQQVCVVNMHDREISHNTVYLLRRAIREANEKKAVALIVDMDTYGGRVDITEELIQLLERSGLKTYTFVNTKAISAGSYISAATDQIFMAPGSVIGAAAPILIAPGGGGVQETTSSYEEKMNSAVRALVRSTAQQNGHNPDVFEAMIDKDRALTIDGFVISEEGKILTLTNEEAFKKYGDPPKPLLSSGTVKDLDELLDQVGLSDAETFVITPTGFEVLGRWITAISPLLILVGFAGIYLEFKTPGLGIPSIVAVICFALYFLGHFAAGLTGMEEVVIFGVGFILLAVELFVLPGFGIAGALGILMILISLILAMTENLQGFPTLPTWPQIQIPILKVGTGFVGSMFAMLLLGRYLPKTSLFKAMELNAATTAAEGYTSSVEEKRSLLDKVGIAETQLRPSGKGRFDDMLVDVVTEGDLIEKGAQIKVTLVEGARVVVIRHS